MTERICVGLKQFLTEGDNMSFVSMLYGEGNKPYSISYSGGSTYTTQTYCEPPQWKLANTMTTEFAPSINGATHTQPLAEFNGGVFNGFAEGLWIYRVFLNGELVATYQFQDQAFCIPIEFDRVEGVCMSVSLSPSFAFANDEPPPPIPSPASIVILICSALFSLRKTSRNA
jgi:hypothetical protein